MLGKITGGRIKFVKKSSLDELDIFILETISKEKNLGTLELSKKIGIAPKNLIVRIKKQFSLGVVQRDKISLKPKGWKRILKVTNKGNSFIKAYKLFQNPK
jgi:DNA-binding Lrp family transcriptional regulator